MLMFGVIEFARIFRRGSRCRTRRAAARYAVTGQWDENTLAGQWATHSRGLS